MRLFTPKRSVSGRLEPNGREAPPGGPPRTWHTLDSQEALDALGTHPDQGLSQNEAEQRLAQYGPNQLRGRAGASPWSLLLNQFKEAMVLVLVAAAAISYVVGDLKDTIVVLAIVVLNAALGFSQEYRAERAMEALRKFAVPHVHCLRDGKIQEIEATRLVPGDLFLLEAGSAVPADGRLIEAVNLKVEEATLTGESVPVEKQAGATADKDASVADRPNMVYMGTSATYGRAKALAVGTGMETELGRIALMLESVQSEQTILQRRMNRLGKRLALLALGLVAVIFLLGVLRGFGITEMLLTAITLAVAAVPEGLPAVVTIALALGARRMVQRNALIRRLPAVETLGSVTTICSDKTGTLTENRMKAVTIQVGRDRLDLSQSNENGGDPGAREILLLAASLCNDAKRQKRTEGGTEIIGDPTEVALVAAAARSDLFKEDLEELLPRVAEAPFSSDRKRMTTVHRIGAEARKRFPSLPPQGFVAFCKGALDGLLEICCETLQRGDSRPLSDQEVQFFQESEDQLASRGQRVLGVALRGLDRIPEASSLEATVEQGMTFVGLVGIVDPPRPEAKTAIQTARAAGIRVLMITGDHQKTAQAIAVELGFQKAGDPALNGRELGRLDPAQFEKSVSQVSIFARVSPEQKLRIVESLQRQGEIVAVTGDGVNDAPALKRAEIGVAMGITGTDVAKEAADAILLDDNFATIVAAVEEGRTIYDNIRKFVRYLLATNLGEICTMLLGLLAGLPVPLLPLQILWINLITDGLPALALGVEPAEPDIMKRPPHPANESLFSRGLWQHVLWVGLMMGILVYLVQRGAIEAGLESWRTMVFTTLALAQMAHVLAIRSEKRSLFTQGLFSNKWMVAAVSSTIFLQLAVVYIPFLQDIFETEALSAQQLVVTAGVSSLIFIAVESEKAIRRRRGYPSVKGGV